MPSTLPFTVVFLSADNAEQILSGWQKHTAACNTYYETALGSLKFSVLERDGGEWYLKVRHTGGAPVSGRVGVRFPWRHSPDGYTLVPGIYYDGNYHPGVYEIPCLRLPEQPCFQASFSAASYPAVLVKAGDQGRSYRLSPRSSAGWNGLELDAEREALTLYAPASEDHPYAHRRFREQARPAFTWRAETVVTLHLQLDDFPCPEVTDLFRYHWDQTIRWAQLPAHNTPKLPEKDGAALVLDWVYRKHCVFTDKGEPLLLNAFEDPKADWPRQQRPEWHIMIGWCSGPMTAYPLLAAGGKYGDFAIRYLDFLAENGNSPSGVKYPIYDGQRWMTPEHRQYRPDYNHCRFYCDYLYYLGRAIRLEKQHGADHPSWEQDFAHGVALLVDLWAREGDFGLYWDLSGTKATVTRRGSGAGAFALLALAEGALHFPEDQRLRACLEEACQVYHQRCVLTGRCNGGPKDIGEAEDSESIAALTDALVQLFRLTGQEEHRQMALAAGRIFATWVVNYVPPFPEGTMFEGVNVCGGVLANVQNRHVGPGICTNSAAFLHELFLISGDARWLDLYRRVKAAAINCITTYDGEFCGKDYGTPFLTGMLSEQINVSDALNPAGETWCVSACWPATAVLLGWADTRG